MAYCTNCGAQTDSRICSNCGERNNRIHKYCYWCGEPFYGPTSKCLKCNERICFRFWETLKWILFALWFIWCGLTACAFVAVRSRYDAVVLFLLPPLVFLPALGKWIRKITYGRKGKTRIRCAVNIVRLFLGAGLFVFACVFTLCDHEWVDATCEHPRYCHLCGETEGTPLEHSWRDATCEHPRECRWCHTTTGNPLKHEWGNATCTAPKTCRLCAATEGAAIGHTLGEPVKKVSVPKAVTLVLAECRTCKALVSLEEIPVTSFVEEGMFLFSPGAFMNRMASLAREAGFDFQYEFSERDNALQVDFLLNANGENRKGFLLFFKDTNVFAGPSERWDSGLWCVNIVADGPPKRVGSNINEELIRLLCMACDPALDAEDCLDVNIKKLESIIKANRKGELAGYYEKNGLLYEFMHILIKDVSVDSILVYPRDWREK